jgi:hypothetical protein
MAKRPAEKSFTTGESRDRIIDEWVKIVGELPSGKFQFETLEGDELVTCTGSARDALHEVIHQAHVQLRFADSGSLAQRKRVVTEIRRMESAAKRLLTSAKANAESYALFHTINEESARLVGNLEPQAFRLLGISEARLTSRRRFEAAVDGVEAIHRWAKATAEQREKVLQAYQSRRKAQYSSRHRHRGDVGLNIFIETIVAKGWVKVWGQKIADGRRLREFVRVATAGVGVSLSSDAIRERIRRAFNLRRVNQRGNLGDPPSARQRNA